MMSRINLRNRRFATASLVTAVVLGTLAGDYVATPASAAAIVSGTSNAFRHGVRSTLRTAHTGGTELYTPGELYGGSNSVALCFTCEASNITGTAPPSASLDVGSGVNTLTGDYSYSLKFSCSLRFFLMLAVALSGRIFALIAIRAVPEICNGIRHLRDGSRSVRTIHLLGLGDLCRFCVTL